MSSFLICSALNVLILFHLFCGCIYADVETCQRFYQCGESPCCRKIKYEKMQCGKCGFKIQRRGNAKVKYHIYEKIYICISNKSNISNIKYEKMQCGFKLKRRENAKVRAISYLPVKFSAHLMQSFHSLLEFGAVQ